MTNTCLMWRFYKICSNGALLYDCMDLCLEHNGIGFEKAFFQMLVMKKNCDLCGENEHDSVPLMQQQERMA